MEKVALDDKYALERGRAFMTGAQALVRLTMLQCARDAAAGLNTSGFVSGYRGSPLGGVDQAFTQAKPFLERCKVRFVPGVNEDLAATACWGTQQLHLFPKPKYDGTFAMWYGKGPGVDRCGDVFRHANYAGTSKHGGVLVVAGDDHGARSSAVAHQTEHIFSACGIPVLAPAGIQEYLDLGIHGWAMSRYAGVWVAMKTTSETAESSAIVEVDPARVRAAVPEDFQLPLDGVHLRWPDPQLAQEHRIQDFKVYAALAYCRANRLNHIVIDSPRPRLGIVACGKAYLDVRQALDDLGIDERVAADIGLRVYKVGMVWPLEAEGVRRFAERLDEILVVEEKRQLLEYQIKEALYNWREDVRPRVVGKYDEYGEWTVKPGNNAPAHSHWLLPPTGELTPAIVARAIAARVGRFYQSDRIRERLAFLEDKERALARPRTGLQRLPWFCPGCPHNTSTRVPEGSCALGGVGCHLMALWMDRRTLTWTHMGGEGATWIGISGGTETPHVFANMGDGTYFHSGILAIRAAVAAGVNITYKLLYNDAVAMTGGQPIDGPLTVPQLTRQLEAEGVARIVVVSDDPAKFGDRAGFAPGAELRHRDDLERVQRELREVPGVTMLVYEQTCAAEKRRRRKRGKLEDPPRRVFINELVCEGCGDCSVKSNCLSVVPVETEFGRRRAIDQSSCNKDYSCLKGFCPALMEIEGVEPRRGAAVAVQETVFAGLEEPRTADIANPYGILITGVGGTGVVTIGALIGMAARLDGIGATVLDMTGLAQKGGAVLSHVRLCEAQDRLHSARIATGEADLMLGCDLVVSIGDEPLAKARAGHTRAMVNTARTITGDFTRNPDQTYPEEGMEREIEAAVGAGNAEFIDATRLATGLMGDSIFTNPFLLGYAWQKGGVPVSEDSLMRAIEMNGVAVEANMQAFRWGRLAAEDLARVTRLACPPERQPEHRRLSRDLDETVARRAQWLTDYQDAAYARRYTDSLARVRAAEARAAPGSTRLAEAVARAHFRLLAAKDEYEVARLHSSPEVGKAIAQAFQGDAVVRLHLVNPFFPEPDPATGEPRKRRFGAWMRAALRLLASMRRLRGSALDPFRFSEERRLERELLAGFESTLPDILARLTRENLPLAVEWAQAAESIRGFGPVKAASAARAKKRQQELLWQMREEKQKQELAHAA